VAGEKKTVSLLRKNPPLLKQKNSERMEFLSYPCDEGKEKSGCSKKEKKEKKNSRMGGGRQKNDTRTLIGKVFSEAGKGKEGVLLGFRGGRETRVGTFAFSSLKR